MESIFAVANWFLKKESMTQKKLQKLCYYAQAWSYALRNEPLVDSEFEAWVHGPVSRRLYAHYGGTGFAPLSPNAVDTAFSPDIEEFLGSVWLTYGEHTGNSLEVLSHGEPPWLNARAGCDSHAKCENKISPDDMKWYYRSIYEGDLETQV